MQFEVEQKFPLEDVAEVEQRLKELGAQAMETVEQVDQYFNHPVRDFAQTDEALRLRSVQGKNFITYKGPKLDAGTKTRRELELPLPHGSAAVGGFVELLTALGFQSVATVRKTRRAFQVQWQGKCVEAALDDVAQVGQFIELELLSEETEIEAAKSCIASLAARLGMTISERRSYLEMLLAARGEHRCD
jgi:adenylate cyclase class 2